MYNMVTTGPLWLNYLKLNTLKVQLLGYTSQPCFKCSKATILGNVDIKRVPHGRKFYWMVLIQRFLNGDFYSVFKYTKPLKGITFHGSISK